MATVWLSQHQTAQAAENEHAAQGGNEGGDADIADPVALPHAHQQAYSQAEHNAGMVHGHVGDHDRRQRPPYR